MGRFLEARTELFLGFLVIALIGLAMWLPDNAITGKVVDDPCTNGRCLELCEMGNGTCSREGTTCCFTHWDAGVCDYAANCEKVREYSLFQTIEMYKDTVQNPPPEVVGNWSQFFFPLLLTIACVAFPVHQSRKPKIPV